MQHLGYNKDHYRMGTYVKIGQLYFLAQGTRANFNNLLF